MKKIYLLLLMLIVGIGSTWAESKKYSGLTTTQQSGVVLAYDFDGTVTATVGTISMTGSFTLGTTKSQSGIANSSGKPYASGFSSNFSSGELH